MYSKSLGILGRAQLLLSTQHLLLLFFLLLLRGWKTQIAKPTEVVTKSRRSSKFAFSDTAGLPEATAFWKSEQTSKQKKKKTQKRKQTLMPVLFLWKELDPRRNTAADTFKTQVVSFSLAVLRHYNMQRLERQTRCCKNIQLGESESNTSEDCLFIQPSSLFS